MGQIQRKVSLKLSVRREDSQVKSSNRERCANPNGGVWQNEQRFSAENIKPCTTAICSIRSRESFYMNSSRCVEDTSVDGIEDTIGSNFTPWRRAK